MLATAMLAGCQDAPIPGDNTENYFSFSAGVAKTRTEAIVEDDGLTFRWTDRDEVGIYGIQDDRSLGDNYAYTAYPDSEDAANCVFRFSTYGQAYQNVAAGSEFYAYYQWFYNIPSAEVIDKVPLNFLKKAYFGLQDLDLDLAVQKVGRQ